MNIRNVLRTADQIEQSIGVGIAFISNKRLKELDKRGVPLIIDRHLFTCTSIEELIVVSGRKFFLRDGLVTTHTVKGTTFKQYTLQQTGQFGLPKVTWDKPAKIISLFEAAVDWLDLQPCHWKPLFKDDPIPRTTNCESYGVTGQMVAYVLRRMVETCEVRWDELLLADVGEVSMPWEVEVLAEDFGDDSI